MWYGERKREEISKTKPMKKHFVNYAVVGITMLFGCLGLAQDQVSFTLEDAKLYALDNNLEIAIANNTVEIARKQIQETRGLGFPQIEFNGTFNHFINLPVTVLEAQFLDPSAPDGAIVSFEAGTKHTSTGAIQANQLLFNGSYIVALQVSKFYLTFQQQSADLSKEDVIFNVIQAYQLASVAKINKSFTDSLVQSSEKLVQQQQHYRDLELILQEDMDQLNYSLLSAKSEQTNADIQYQNALNMLKLSMGYPIHGSIEIIDLPNDLLTKSSIKTGDIHQNIKYSLIEKKVKLSQYNVKNRTFENLPSLNAFFHHSYNAYRNKFNFFEDKKWFPQTVWGIQLSVPVFSGLSRYARTSQAKIQLLNDQNSLIQMERSLEFQEVQMKNNLRGAEETLSLQKKNLELANLIYKNAIIKKKIGKGNGVTVTQKHGQLILAEAKYIGSMMETFNARLALDKMYNNILTNQITR